MGVAVFLLIVAVIIVLVVLKNKRKKEKAIEDLKNSNAYALAIKIRDELEKKEGYDFGEPSINYIGNAYGDFLSILPSRNNFIHIRFSEYMRGPLDYAKHNIRMDRARGKRSYGIENANIGVLVFSDEDSQDMPEYIKIAAEVIKNSGYGSCTQIE